MAAPVVCRHPCCATAARFPETGGRLKSRGDGSFAKERGGATTKLLGSSRDACRSVGRVVRVVEKPSASSSGMSTLRDLPCRSARHVFPSIHPAQLDGAAS